MIEATKSNDTKIRGNINQMRNNLRREKEEKQRENYNERRVEQNKDGNNLYSTKYWKRLRNNYIMNNPCCEIHMRYGIVKPAEEVHHKKFISSGKTLDEQRELCFDFLNLQSLCRECHHGIHILANNRNVKYVEDYVPPECMEY